MAQLCLTSESEASDDDVAIIPSLMDRIQSKVRKPDRAPSDAIVCTISPPRSGAPIDCEELITSDSNPVNISVNNLPESFPSTSTRPGFSELLGFADCGKLPDPVEKIVGKEVSKSKQPSKNVQKKSQQRLVQKRQQKELAAMQKKLQQNARLAKKTERGEECFKLLTVELDSSIVEGTAGPALLLALESIGMSVHITNHRIKGAVTWTRSSVDQGSKSREDVALLVLSIEDLVEEISKGDKLSEYRCKIKESFPGFSVILIVCGKDKYFRGLETKLQREHRERILKTGGNVEPKRKQKQARGKMDAPVISRMAFEEGLLDLQLDDIGVEFPGSAQDTADLVAGYSKAVAEAPARRRKEVEDSEFEFVIAGDDKDARLKPSLAGDGRGLTEVWQRQLMQFHRLSPDIAAAIAAVYPTPLSLIKAYRQTSSRSEAESLLQNIQVRRGAGLLATTRQVGIGHSRRIYLFMMSSNKDLEFEDD